MWIDAFDYCSNTLVNELNVTLVSEFREKHFVLAKVKIDGKTDRLINDQSDSNGVLLPWQYQGMQKCVNWLVVLRIYVALAVFQPYCDLDAGDNQSLKFKWRGGESNPGPLAPQAKSLTTQPPPLLRNV